MATGNKLAKDLFPITGISDPKSEAKEQENAISTMSMAKEAKALEVAMIAAKRFPRDYASIEDKILRNCTRRRLAEAAEYSYPRADTTISGPSVKLLEVVAQCYGNIEFGANEVQRYADYSDCEAFAWDFENNVKVTRKFTVPHFRDTKRGKQRLTEDRDIREMIFNFGSRNMRSCLERVIPRDLVESAIDACRKTLNGTNAPFADLINNAKELFRSQYSIDGEFLQKLVGEKFEKWTKYHYNQACKYSSALDEGETTVTALKEQMQNKDKEEAKFNPEEDFFQGQEAEQEIEIDENAGQDSFIK